LPLQLLQYRAIALIDLIGANWSGQGDSFSRCAGRSLYKFATRVAPKSYLDFDDNGNRTAILPGWCSVPLANGLYCLAIGILVETAQQLNTTLLAFVTDHRQ
jgi:hypothetical protein